MNKNLERAIFTPTIARIETVLLELQQMQRASAMWRYDTNADIPRTPSHIYIFMNENRDVRFTHRLPFWSKYLSTVAAISRTKSPCVPWSAFNSSTHPRQRECVSDHGYLVNKKLMRTPLFGVGLLIRALEVEQRRIISELRVQLRVRILIRNTAHSSQHRPGV